MISRFQAHAPKALAGAALLLVALGSVGCASSSADEGSENVTGEAEQALVLGGVRLKTVIGGQFVGAQNNGGGNVIATATVAQAWETFSLDDTNGGALTSGDTVTVRTGGGQYFKAQNGGGSTLSATATVPQGWETFTIVKAAGSGTINNGDVVGLRAQTGQYVRAVNGGGSSVDVQGAALSTWEQFTVSGLPVAPNSDPTCSTGIRSGDACCPAACGACGGTGCGSRPGGTDACCTTPILAAAVSCSGSLPPCVVGDGTTPQPSQKKVIGYLPNWYGSYASWVNKIDFSKLTHINLAFVTADGNGNLQLASNADIDTFVAAAHARGVKVFPSIGGGGGDASIAPWYQPARVDAFVDRIINFVLARKFDGIDVDQESPGIMGANYNTFIAKLKARAAVHGLPVSAAVAQWMQSGMSDATLRSFDMVNVMAYDATGTWTGAGEHSSYAQAQAQLAFYVGKGVAKDKLVLGVPFYGYCWGNCDGQASKYVLYKDILAKFSWASTTDWIQQNGATYSFNGTATMQRKADLAEQYGGIMIWELAGDVPSTNSTSLLRAIDAALP